MREDNIMHNTNKYLSFFRYYRDENISNDFAWWFCLIDNKVYETTEIYKLFGHSSKEDINSTNLFIEFPKIDIIELKKKYLLHIGLKKQLEKCETLSDEEFDIKFNQYIDNKNLIKDWYDFEYSKLSKIYSQWCNTNKILLK